MAYTVFTHDLNDVTMWIQIAGAVFLVISIVIFIRAYKKDNFSTALYGIELAVLAIVAAILPGTYLDFVFPFNKLNVIFPYAFLAYYLIKVMVIGIKTKRKLNKLKGKKK